MLKCRNVLWGLLPLVLLSACAHPQKETWIDTTNAAYSTDVPEERASVVFYRQSDAIDGPTVNVYVNSQYLGSLQPNAYRQEFVCAQNQKFYADFTNRDAAYEHKASSGNYYNLPEGTVSFFKVINDGSGRPILQNVSPEQAEAEMQGVKRQNHTLSRVVGKEKCTQVLQKYNLQASALFRFDRSGYQDMLEQGKREVSAITRDIKQHPSTVTGINVIGHTDPEGSTEYNDALSDKRAQTVKRALSESGVDGSLIQTQARGKRDLTVADCRKRFPNNAKARRACNQPNRRVEIILHGEK